MNNGRICHVGSLAECVHELFRVILVNFNELSENSEGINLFYHILKRIIRRHDNYLNTNTHFILPMDWVLVLLVYLIFKCFVC